MTRREAIASLGASVLTARAAFAQQATEKNGGLKAGAAPPPRTTPMICVYSQNLIKVPYPELGFIAQQIGYDGVDLTVFDGGHVDPKITNVDMVRAIESVRGAGLEVPMISTVLNGVADRPCTASWPSLATPRCTSIAPDSGRGPLPRAPCPIFRAGLRRCVPI